MQLRLFSVSFLVAAFMFSAEASAGECLKDMRRIKVDRANVARLLDYLCSSDQNSQTRVRVQFQRLSGLAPGVVLNGGSAPWLSALYGTYRVADNDVLMEYKRLISRFGLRVKEIDQGGGEGKFLGLVAGTAAQVDSGKLSETARGHTGQVVRSFMLAPLPDIPLVDETLEILNEQIWPASLSMSYGNTGYDNSADRAATGLDNLFLWRYLTADDARQYAKRLRRYKSLVVSRSYFEEKELPRSMELLNYLTANGWPENFLYASTPLTKLEPCLTLDFKVHQYSFEVEVAIIENASAKPITVSQLLGQASGSNQLQHAPLSPRTTGTKVLPSEPMMLAPSSRLIVPLRLVFADDDPAINLARERNQAQRSFRDIMARPPGTVFRTEIYSALRGDKRGKESDTFVIHKARESFKPPSYPIRSDFAFGPEWTLTGLTIDGETMRFNATSPNVIQITASTEAGSCPILYSWDTDAAAWVRHGKVLHQAQTSAREASETVQFDGLVHRFRLAEEELERATIRYVSLQLEINDGRTLTLQPERQLAACTRQHAAELVAELYANDDIEISFALPDHIDAAQVIRSSFTIAGYYDRYAAQLIRAAMTKPRLDGN